MNKKANSNSFNKCLGILEYKQVARRHLSQSIVRIPDDDPLLVARGISFWLCIDSANNFPEGSGGFGPRGIVKGDYLGDYRLPRITHNFISGASHRHSFCIKKPKNYFLSSALRSIKGTYTSKNFLGGNYLGRGL